MSIHRFLPGLAGLVGLILLAGCGKSEPPAPVPVVADIAEPTNAPPPAAGMMRFDAKSGSGMNMRIEGTSTIHDWQVEGPLIGGFIEVGPGFPVEPGQVVAPGKVQARVEAFVPVRSLKSIEKDGSPFSDKMNEVMYEKLKQAANPKVFYRLNELELKEAAKTKDAPYVFDSKGELVVAGKTNKISMPINITPLGDKKIKVTGTVSIKMSDFGVEPPVLIGILSTGDEVKLKFEWMVIQKAPPAAAK
jgi:hypothetical protein